MISPQSLMYSFVKGALDFMAVEVEWERYQFGPRKLVVAGSAVPSAARVFRYNPLHDLESLWRVALWIMFNHRDSRDEVVHSSLDRQTKYAGMFFPGILNHGGRIGTLKDDELLFEAVAFLPVSFRATGMQLEAVRQGLVDGYRLAEANAEINPAAFQGIHTLFLNEFIVARDLSVGIQLCPLDDPPAPKRSRGNSVASTRGQIE
jgi:hypothetical protein